LKRKIIFLENQLKRIKTKKFNFNDNNANNNFNYYEKKSDEIGFDYNIEDKEKIKKLKIEDELNKMKNMKK
jgi:hypothetical protein